MVPRSPRPDHPGAHGGAPLRIAVIDADSGLPPGAHQAPRPARLGAPRAGRAGSGRGDRRDARSARSSSTSPILGPRAGTTSSALRRAARARRRRLHRPVDRRPARARAADGRRRLGRPSRATPRSCIARVEAVVRRRRRAERASTPARCMAGELEIRADQFQAFVDGASIDLTRREFELHPAARRGRGPRPRARGDLPARLGLRDGARRPLGGRVRAQAAPEAREGVARTGATSTRTSGSATASPPSAWTSSPIVEVVERRRRQISRRYTSSRLNCRGVKSLATARNIGIIVAPSRRSSPSRQAGATGRGPRLGPAEARPSPW